MPAHLSGVPRSSRGKLPPEGDSEILSCVFAPSHLPEAPYHFAVLLKFLKNIWDPSRLTVVLCVCDKYSQSET